MRKALRFGWIAIVVLVLLTSCTGRDNDLAVEQPVKGGDFNIGLVKLGSADPAKAATVSERVIADILYDGLVAWDSKTLAAIPALATRWESSDDKKQWTFYLREGVVASNGDVIKASDVKATLERIAKPDSQSSVRESLGSVAGMQSLIGGEKTSLDGVVVVNDSTVRIDLDNPQADFPRLLGNPAFGIVHVVDGNLISTGPFSIGSQDADKTMTLKRTSQSTAYIDNVNVTFFSDVNATYTAMNEGKLDWVPIAQDKAEEAGQKYGSHQFRQSLRSFYLTFNVQNPKFTDQRFREAIVHAIDRNAVARLISPASSVLNGVVVNDVPGSQGGGCGTSCAYNVDRAKELIKDQFGETAPPSIAIDISEGPPFTEAATKKITEDLAAVGVTVQIRYTPADKYSSVTVKPEREIFQTSWSAAYPSPDAFLTPLFQSTSLSNVSGLKEQKVDESIAQAQGEPDAAKRLAKWQTAERNVMGYIPVIPIAQFPVNSVASKRVRGLSVLPTGNFDIPSVWLSVAP